MGTGLRLVAMAAALALAVGAEACSRSASPSTPTPVPTNTPTPLNPEALLRQSGQAMESLASFQFRLGHKSGGTVFAPGLLIQEAEGTVIKPDKISAQFSGSLGGFAIRSGLVTLGGAGYMTNPLTGRWESVPTEVSPLGFFNPSLGIAAIMSHVDQVGLLPDGKGVHKLKGRLPAEALAPLLGATVKGTSVAMELTIDASLFYLLEAVVDGRVTSGEPDGTVRVITLSRFNEPFTIQPPQ